MARPIMSPYHDLSYHGPSYYDTHYHGSLRHGLPFHDRPTVVHLTMARSTMAQPTMFQPTIVHPTMTHYHGPTCDGPYTVFVQKLLNVTISNTLCWDANIDYPIKKCNSYLFSLSTINVYYLEGTE